MSWDSQSDGESESDSFLEFSDIEVDQLEEYDGDEEADNEEDRPSLGQNQSRRRATRAVLLGQDLFSACDPFLTEHCQFFPGDYPSGMPHVCQEVPLYCVSNNDIA